MNRFRNRYPSIVKANMPLPSNTQAVETSETLNKTMRGAFGTPGDYRPGQLKKFVVLIRIRIEVLTVK